MAGKELSILSTDGGSSSKSSEELVHGPQTICGGESLCIGR